LWGALRLPVLFTLSSANVLRSSSGVLILQVYYMSVFPEIGFCVFDFRKECFRYRVSQAREEIIAKVLRCGWIRLRWYLRSAERWSFTLNDYAIRSAMVICLAPRGPGGAGAACRRGSGESCELRYRRGAGLRRRGRRDARATGAAVRFTGGWSAACGVSRTRPIRVYSASVTKSTLL
jgi:hypothetical protein